MSDHSNVTSQVDAHGNLEFLETAQDVLGSEFSWFMTFSGIIKYVSDFQKLSKYFFFLHLNL